MGEKDKILESQPIESIAGSTIPIILVVTRYGRFADPVMDYAVNVAERLQCKLLATYINPLPQLFNEVERLNLRNQTIQENVAVFQAKAKARGVSLDHVRESGRPSKVISRLCHIVRRIEFVVIDKGIKMDEITSRVPIPVFNVFYVTPSSAHDTTAPKRMAHAPKVAKPQPLNHRFFVETGLSGLVLFSIAALTLYSPGLIIDNWRMGGSTAVVTAIMAASGLLAVFSLGRNVTFLAHHFLAKRSGEKQDETKLFPSQHVQVHKRKNRQTQPRV